MPQLIDTISDILELSGAAVERNRQSLETLLPAETARALQLHEQAVLCFDPQEKIADGELVTYQSELVDRIFGLMQNKGLFAEIKVADQHLKQGTAAAAEGRFTVLNGLWKALGAVERRLRYACVNFKYTAMSDEKKEGFTRAVINEHTLSPVPGLTSQLQMTAFSEGEGYLGLETQPFKQVHAAACRQAHLLIRSELVEFQRSLHRRSQRDVARLNEYYQSLIDEIDRKIARRQLEGKEREDQEARKGATELERGRKIADVRAKYAIKVEVEPISLLRINLPVMVVTAELRWRKLSREIFLIWNPLLKEFEALPCESCGAGLFAMQLCEEKLHVLCQDCSQCEGCQRNLCHRCHPGKCPKCGKIFARV
ncbi:MAG: hypothetical protein ACREOO_19515 [bacterium]